MSTQDKRVPFYPGIKLFNKLLTKQCSLKYQQVSLIPHYQKHLVGGLDKTLEALVWQTRFWKGMALLSYFLCLAKIIRSLS